MSIGKAAQEEWDWCRRCGRQYHVSQLMKQEGQIRCTVVPCTDDLSNKYRKYGIAQVLADGSQEGSTDKDQIFSDPGEIAFS